ncbi:MAG: VCBS repeat-containing protein, partial [Anaerolineae bacterium]
MFNPLNRRSRLLEWSFGLTLILLIGLVLFAAPQTVRAWYRELVLVWTAPAEDRTSDVAWGDYDGDGDLDLLVGNYKVDTWTPGTQRVYANDGGTFTEVWSVSFGDVHSVDWGDWDGDGDLDIALGADGTNRVYTNTGIGFSSAWTSPESEPSTSIAWGDMNGDGRADLAVGNGQNAPNRVYTSTGSSLVLAWTAPVTQSTTSVAWADYDGDGDLDLAVGNTDTTDLQAANLIYRNDGGMLNPSPAWTSPEVEDTCGLAWGDFDGNGYPDLAVANGCNAYWSYEQQPDRVYANVGGSLSSVWTSPEILDSNCTAWGDWDGDGDLDLFIGNENQRMAGFVYQNGGNGAFTLAQTISADDSPEFPTAQESIDGVDWGDYDGDGDDDLVIDSKIKEVTDYVEHVLIYASGGGALDSDWAATDQATDDTHAVAWGDWDSDGRLDLAVGNDGDPLRIYTYNGGTPSLAWSSTLTDPVRSLAWGDWDADGDLDLAVGSDGAPNRVYENDGGSLSVTWSAPVVSATQSVAWGDWDEDGDLDLAVGNDSEPNQVYENDGGTLSPAWTSTEADATQSLAWGDWDGDDDLDLGVGNDGAANRVYENGVGSLSLVWSAPVVSATQSVAWGDYDGDGTVDLAVGNDAEPNQVYTNTGGGLTLAWTSPEADVTHQVAWGDWDGDGDLDLAAGNGGNPNRVYANTGTTLSAAWASPESDHTRSIAWGDWDGDGDLDLAAGNWFNAVRVYDNGSPRIDLAWSSVARDATMDTAWGDWDGDGDLDLAVANYEEPNRVYENVNGLLEPAWTSDEWDPSTSLAWGDWDGDGDLDLAVGNGVDDYHPYLQVPNRVYENTGGALTLAWTSPETDRTMDVAWGDWDGDGDLDLGVGNWPVVVDGYMDGENRVYENTGGALTLAWTGPEGTDRTSSIAWADWDGDGDLDLAVGNGGSADEGTYSQPNRVYRNDGDALTQAWTSSATEPTTSIAWGDWDTDGDPDLAVGEGEEYDHVYLNTGGALTLTWTSTIGSDDIRDVAWGDWDNDGDPDLLFANTNVHEYAEYGVPRPDYLYVNTGGSLTLWGALPDRAFSESVEWGDYDGDGDLDLAIGNGGLNYALLDPVPFNRPNWIYQNHTADVQALSDTPTHVRIVTPGSDQAGFFHSATILQGPTVTITYRLVDPESDPVHFVTASYSTDGGAHWQPAVAASGTVTTGLATSPAGTAHTFVWDIYASGFQGASDNTVFRIEAYQGLTGSGPFLTPFRTVRSGPFRLRGSQVRVMSGTLPVENGIVYRLPASGGSDYEPYRDLGGRILRTGPSGYLEGWGQIALGDRLVALAPVTGTESYMLYHTTAAPTLTGVEPYTVTELGVQTLVVTETHPLVLLTLDVSLEWDARQDEQFLSQLDYNLRRASELLFDWTNGQVALGETTIYHDRQHWLDAHVRIYATNRMRPNAAQGGIVSTVITDPVTSTLTYAPGQVHMGAVWNRYGDPSGTLGEDWPRTLAHELGHFALYLDDNYLGFSDSGLLIPVDGCDGTAMTDPYRDDFSEFHPAAGWLPGC